MILFWVQVVNGLADRPDSEVALSRTVIGHIPGMYQCHLLEFLQISSQKRRCWNVLRRDAKLGRNWMPTEHYTIMSTQQYLI
jgi:hypothetical protein